MPCNEYLMKMTGKMQIDEIFPNGSSVSHLML